MRRLAALGGALILALAGVAGCGVPAEDHPREVKNRTTPFPAFRNGPASAQAGAAEEPLCFVKDGKLVPVVRRVRAWPTVETQARDLLAEPNESERRSGLTSTLTGTTAITGIRLSQRQVTVELADDRDGPGRSDEILAFGQIVCTLTTRPDVIGVAFERGGARLNVPRADGSLSQGPLGRADYASLIVD